MEDHRPNETSDGNAAISGNGNAPTNDPHGGVRSAGTHSHFPEHHSPRTKLNVGIFAMVVSIALLAIFLVVHHSHSVKITDLQNETTLANERPVPVDVVRVQRAAGEGALNLPGDARSFYETTIFGRTNGYVSKWLADIGDQVVENQVLAIIETPELDDQLRESKANFAQLKAQANVAATNAQFAKISFDRWEAAAPEGAVSKQERDEKKAEFDSANAKLEASKAAINLGEAQVQRLETLEKFKEVVAPFDGIITQRFLDIGSLVTAGSTTNTTPLYTIAQSTRMRVFVDVPQPAVQDIHVGMNATATVAELPGQIFTGVVDRTASSLDVKSRTLKVEVLVPNPNLALLPGMYVQVAFETSRKIVPLRIPAAALSFSPAGPQVAVVGTDRAVTFRPVTISRDMGDMVEISSGISENEMVALNIGTQVSNGEAVDAHLVDMPAPPQRPKGTSPISAATTLPTAVAR